MRIVAQERLGETLSALPGAPRVVAGGNYATPGQSWRSSARPSRTLGQIDYAIEADLPLASPTARPVRDTSALIGHRVATLVPDGATLQLGIGAVPDAVLGNLFGRRGLGVWSEMFSDGVLALHKAGPLDPARQVTASFAFGSPELYGWMDRNPAVAMLRTEVANDPARIAQRSQMVSVNTALEVDLFSQVNASRVHELIYSPASAGRPISWSAPCTRRAAGRSSRCPPGIAHPCVRDELREAGRELGFRV